MKKVYFFICLVNFFWLKAQKNEDNFVIVNGVKIYKFPGCENVVYDEKKCYSNKPECKPNEICCISDEIIGACPKFLCLEKDQCPTYIKYQVESERRKKESKTLKSD